MTGEICLREVPLPDTNRLIKQATRNKIDIKAIVARAKDLNKLNFTVIMTKGNA